MIKLTPATPAALAAQSAISERFGALADALRRIERHPGEPSVRDVHQLRIQTRRAAAAMAAYKPCLGADALTVSRKQLRKLRKTAAQTRDCDVLLILLDDLSADSSTDAIRLAHDLLGRQRNESASRILRAVRRCGPERIDSLCRGLIESITPPLKAGAQGASLLDLAAPPIDRAAQRLQIASKHNLHNLESLHELRIAVKKLRYTLDIFKPALDLASRKDAKHQLKTLQSRLGDINDQRTLLAKLQGWIDRPPDISTPSDSADVRTHKQAMRQLQSLTDIVSRSLEDNRVTFMRWWREQGGDIVAQLQAISMMTNEPHKATTASTGDTHIAVTTTAPFFAQTTTPTDAVKRLAAIDVGTNSIRLIVAEAFEQGGYRIIDDEREIARLGQGLATTGAMESERMRRAATSIARMKTIATGYGVELLRVAGTCVVREASNRDEFLSLVKERAGVDVQILTAQQEGSLAHKSVVNAFDLQSLDVAVADIGGGSTEIILSAGGVIERNLSLKLGAVRLTERFGGPEIAATTRFDELCGDIDKHIDEAIGQSPITPRIVIGCGGTFTNLAEIHLRGEIAATEQGEASSVVRGHEIRFAAVERILDFLRTTPLEQRADIAGLSKERADIIVAGVAIARSVMRRTGADWLRVHDKGVRDGLLLTMVGELFPQRDAAITREERRRRAVLKFALTCNYDRQHCAHVCALVLELFDQLAKKLGADAAPWATPANRALLEAAAILHDIGYHINYTSHHRHSLHLIIHSDLEGFTQRQIDMIANIARYHRRAEPKRKHPAYARLNEADQRSVSVLASLLRIADGLDRTHQGVIHGFSLDVRSNDVNIQLKADAEPVVEIWGAQRKADLFTQTLGLTPIFTWTDADTSADASSINP